MKHVEPVTPPEPSELTTLLRRGTVKLAQELDDLTDDPVAIGAAVARLDGLANDLAIVSTALKRRCGHLMVQQRRNQIVLRSLAVVELSGGTRRDQWRHAELARALVKADTVRNGGEAPTTLGVVGLLLECAGIVYWKAQECANYGVDVDEFCVRTDDPTVVAKANVEVGG